ncbi:membrane protein [Psychroserpens damuponensis]|uniref:membrane protein n=1 Tax=Psychroserpens damuponensis TaxID=943936 RepID=UPI00058D3F92|nr:membrane protein [Psychroserpens damuponensis]
MQHTAENNNDNLAIIAYITLIGTLIAFFLNRDKPNPLVSFHIRQALGLWLLQMLLGYFIGAFNSWMISMSFWIFFIALFIYGIIGAVGKKMNEVPILGPLFQKWFSNIG